MKIGIISGASSGIGKAIARELDLLGLDELWLIARNEEKLNNLKAELKTNVRCFSVNLAFDSAHQQINSALKEGKYEIVYLVNSAGVGYTGAFKDNSVKCISDMIDINCRGLSLLTSISLPFLTKEGKIINVASAAGFLPQADFAVYSATKSYVISFSRALRKELKPQGIHVCAVCPGPVDTDFFANLKEVKEYKKKYLITPEKVAKFAIKGVNKNKAICTTSLSISLLHLASKVLPTSLLLKFAK